jgi:hypothetical protein
MQKILKGAGIVPGHVNGGLPGVGGSVMGGLTSAEYYYS